MVACYYFNGASCRRRSGPDQPFDSSPEEALKNGKLPVPPRTHTEVGARRGSSEWTDVCGFVKLPRSPSEWFMMKHGACETNRQELGLSPQDRTCHLEVWIL